MKTIALSPNTPDELKTIIRKFNFLLDSGLGGINLTGLYAEIMECLEADELSIDAELADVKKEIIELVAADGVVTVRELQLLGYPVQGKMRERVGDYLVVKERFSNTVTISYYVQTTPGTKRKNY